MPWIVDFLPQAVKELGSLDREAAARIVATLENRIATLPNPRQVGRPLKGSHQGYWRWRVGEYRIIAEIDDAASRIRVIAVGHRRKIYR